MADIKLRIEVNPNAESEFLGNVSTTNLNVANTSIPVSSIGEMEIPKTEFAGSNGLLWGEEDYLVFNDNDELDNVENNGGYLESEESSDEFFWGLVPQNKEYSVKLTFTDATNLKDIVVFGDKVNNQFPTEAIVDGEKTIYSNDYYWAINLEDESDTHTIEFTKWNRANYNACLTLIRVMLHYIEIDKLNGLKSVESLSQRTGQPREIFYGVVPNEGSVEIIDVDGEIADMVKDGVISESGFKVDIIANSKQVQSHLSSENEYRTTTGSKKLQIQLDNALSDWQNINFVGYRLNNECSLYDVLVEILSPLYSVNEINEMLDSTVIDMENVEESVKDYLKNIILKYPYIQSGKLREAIDKICTLAQLNVYQNDNGKIKFVSSRPIRPINKSIIQIKQSNQQIPFDSDLVVKNKYKSVNVNYLKTSLIDRSLDSRTIKYYEYDTISKKLQDYKTVINNPNVNEGLTVIKPYIPSPNNPSDPFTGNHWYYYMAKFDVSFDVLDLKILRNFNPKFKHSVTMIFPDNQPQIRTGGTTSETLKYYDSSYTDEDMINLWYVDGKFDAKNFDFKVRRNADETYTVFYVSLYLITSKAVGYVGQNEDVIVSIYNELHLEFLAPEIEQSQVQLVENAEVNIDSNELLQDATTLNGESMPSVIQRNILSDYSNGILTGSINVNCLDYYEINGKKAKDWSKGEILQLGDIVRIDKDKNETSAIKYSNGDDMYFMVTGRRFRNSGVPLIDLELQEAKIYEKYSDSKSFAEDSWDLINRIARDGLAEQYYKVGDEKTIQLTNGEQVSLVILGFNHDDLTSGGKAPITIGMKDCLSESYQMNTTSTNVGGWNTSYMRTTIMPSLLSKLPIDLQKIIKSVDKRASAGNKSTDIIVSRDKIWLFCEEEISGTAVYSSGNEGTIYQYWTLVKDGSVSANRIKNANGSPTTWWLRSSGISNDRLFCNFTGKGLYNETSATFAQSVSFGFCI